MSGVYKLKDNKTILSKKIMSKAYSNLSLLCKSVFIWFFIFYVYAIISNFF